MQKRVSMPTRGANSEGRAKSTKEACQDDAGSALRETRLSFDPHLTSCHGLLPGPLLSWALLERSWGQLGLSGSPHGAIWGPLGALFGPSTAVEPPRSPSWSALGALWGPSWTPLGAILGPLGALMGPSWAPLDPSWSHLRPSSGHLEPSWNPKGGRTRTPGNLTRNHSFLKHFLSCTLTQIHQQKKEHLL